jgi:nitrate reductase delta subunit
MQTATDITSTCASLSTLLEYPSLDYLDKVRSCRDRLVSPFPEASELVQEFLGAASGHTLEELEEIYTRTFDMAPICLPYVASYIFGDESFDRGKLMTGLVDAYARLGFDTGGELPDHLALLLRFAGHLDEAEFADLVEYCLEKPVGEMVDKLQGADNLYAPAMRAIQLVLAGAPKERGDD